MATRKRAPKKTTKKGPSGKGRGKASRKKGDSPLSRLGEGLSGAFTREAVGVLLLAIGLFFSAAFISGRGAFLGDAGSWVVTRVLGWPGLALAPIAAFAGLLLLIGRLRGRVVAGAFLLLSAVAATFAAALQRGQLFSVRHYPDAGGLLGSGFYWGVQGVGGAIGAALVIGLLYALGFSLLTGVSFATAIGALGSAGASLGGWVGGLPARMRESRERLPERSPKSQRSRMLLSCGTCKK